MDPNLNTIIAERQQKQNNPNITRFLNPKIIFLILGVIILVEVIFGVTTLINSSSSPAPVVQQQTIAEPILLDGSISLSALSSSVKLGQKLVVFVDISTGGHEVLGGDVILNFNPKMLTLTKTDIQPGTAFTSYPLIEVDLKTGIIRISGVAEGQNFIGDGRMASITFTALSAGVENVTIEYKEGDSRDSNLVSSEGVDILKVTKDINIEIKP